MSLPKLLDYLATKCLYFAEASTLGDAHEGTLPRRTHERLNELESLRVGNSDLINTEEGFATKLRHSFYVSSWSLSASESYALWKVYGQSQPSVALRMLYSELVNSLDDSCFVGRVKYVDFEEAEVSTMNAFNLIMHKRKEYSYESEVRVVKQAIRHGDGVVIVPAGEVPMNHPSLSRYPRGLLVPLDMSRVESMWLSPDAAPWLLDALRSVLSALGVPGERLKSSGIGAPPRLAPRRVSREEVEILKKLGVSRG